MTPTTWLNRCPGVAVAAATVVTLAVAGCAPIRVHSYAEPGASLAAYHTFDWAPDDSLETGDPRLDNSPFFHEHLRAAAEKVLARHGFERATGGTPQLLLHYHASVTQRIDVSAFDEQYGYSPYLYDAGTLLFDFVDARTRKIVWRGWAEASLDGAIDDQAWMENRVDDAVSRILGRLPL